jgi:hypothetical protein
MAQPDFLLIIEPRLVSLAPAQIRDPLHKARLDSGLIGLVRVAVGAEKPFCEKRMVADDRAPAI